MKRVSALFLLWILQGLAAFAWLALLPTDTEHGLLFGFSATRLLLLAGMLALTALSAALLWFSRRADFSLPTKFYTPLRLFCVALAVFAPLTILVLNALGQTSGFTYSAYALRLAPPALWAALSALELVILLALQKRPSAGSWSLLRPALIVWLILVLLVAFVALTGLGLTRYNDGSWGEPTTPLLEWQILLALLSSLIFLAGETRWKWLKTERFTALFIYVLTCLVWLSQPVNPGFFATPPRAPNFEIYPFSDALIYAQYAQSALAGKGFMWPDVPTRPLYISFLTWLHALAGQDYNRVIALQTLVLAAFPAVLYLLGRELAGRPFGFGLALLAIFRDLTANIAAPFALNYTYTKLFFSEIPTALLISLFTLMVLRWMRRSVPAWYPLLAGGLLGLSALIRLQSAVILAALIPLAFFIVRDRKKWLVGSALMVLGVTLALIPWLARNRLATGGLVLDNPISQTMVLARRWGGNSGNQIIPHLPGEGDAQYSSRMTAQALASLRADPGRILGSAANHFLNNEIGNLLVFPLRDQLDSPRELLWPEHAFWQTWNGQPTPGQLPLLALYLALFGLGLAAAWRLNGLSGLLPLALSLVYNLWTALFLSSGDRFLVPLDWAIYLYHFLGLLTLANLLLDLKIPGILPQPSVETDPGSIPFSWRKTALITLLILFLGASVPLTEYIFSGGHLISPAAALNQDLSPQEVSLNGRAIYPRWYDAGDGEPGSAKQGYGAVDQARLVFFLVGDKNTLVILPLKNSPQFFPNASTVTVTGTLDEGFINARKIVIKKDGKTVEYVP